MSLQPCFFNRERLVIAKDHRSLDDVLKLANVPRAVISLKQFERLLRYVAELLAGLFRTVIDEIPVMECLRLVRVVPTLGLEIH